MPRPLPAPFQASAAMLLPGDVTATAWLPTCDVISTRQWSYPVSALSGDGQRRSRGRDKQTRVHLLHTMHSSPCPNLYIALFVVCLAVQLCIAAVPTREICRSVSTLPCSAASRAGCLRSGGSATAHSATPDSSALFAVPTRKMAIPVC